MPEISNKEIVADVQEIREHAIEPPENRSYRLLARRQSVRVVFDADAASGVFGASDVKAFSALRRRGYALSGGNFDTRMLVFTKE